MIRILFCLLTLAICCARLTATPNEQKEIQALYAGGLRGDKAAVEECIARLERVLQSDPRNQLARVYLGSAYTLRSRDLGFGPKKLRTLKDGLALMDQAVAAAPDDPRIRLARARTDSALPALFGRGATSRSDFALLKEMAKTNPARFEPADLEAVQTHR